MSGKVPTKEPKMRKSSADSGPGHGPLKHGQETLGSKATASETIPDEALAQTLTKSHLAVTEVNVNSMKTPMHVDNHIVSTPQKPASATTAAAAVDTSPQSSFLEVDHSQSLQLRIFNSPASMESHESRHSYFSALSSPDGSSNNMSNTRDSSNADTSDISQRTEDHETSRISQIDDTERSGSKKSRDRMILNAPIYSPTNHHSFSFQNISNNTSNSTLNLSGINNISMSRSVEDQFDDGSRKVSNSSMRHFSENNISSVSPPHTIQSPYSDFDSRSTNTVRKTSEPLSMTSRSSVRRASDSPSITSPSNIRRGPESPSLIHSTSTVNWNANDPTEWTMDRVVFWLETNKFGQEWVDVFTKKNLCGNSFLDLINYQKLRSVAPIKTDDPEASPSRFIHLLRKLLNRPNSMGTTEVFTNASTTTLSATNIAIPPVVPVAPVAPAASSGSSSSSTPAVTSASANINYDRSVSSDTSLNSPPKIVSHKSEDSDLSINDTLSPGSILSPSKSALPRAPKSFENLLSIAETEQQVPIPRPRTSVSNRPRPMSTFETTHSSKYSWSGNSPSSPLFRQNLWRRHQKSSSSDSMNDDGSSSSSSNKQSHSSGRSSFDALDRPSRASGIFNMLKPRAYRSGAKDHPQGDSNSNARAKTPQPMPSRQSLQLQLPPQSYQPVPVKLTGYEFLEKSLRPVKVATPPNNRFILVSFDDETYTRLNISEVSNVVDLRKLISARFSLPINDFKFHITEFGHTKGEELDDKSLSDALLVTHEGIDILKIYLSVVQSQPTSSSTGSNISSYASSMDGLRQNYPSTPAYLINKPAKPGDDADYFNVYHGPADPPSQPAQPAQPTHKQFSSQEAPKPQELVPPPVQDKKESFRVIRREYSNESFRVLRPKRKEMVEADDKKGVKSPNLVALRNAPPPPPNRTSSIKSVLSRHSTVSKSKKSSSNSSTHLEPGSESGDDVKAYSPGPSETIIPRPYVSRKKAVIRKPVNGSSGVRAGSNSSQGTITPLTADGPFSFRDPQYDGDSGGGTRHREVSVAVGPDIVGPGDTIGRDEKFTENDISWDNAPEYVDPDDDTDDDDGSGLWAKKPPSVSSTMLKPYEQEKPSLSVDTEKSRTPSLSPRSPYRTPVGLSPLAPEDTWAVRPPAEVVYDNLERYFPNTDLDKPIIDEVTITPSPLTDATSIGSTNPSSLQNSPLSPVVEPKESSILHIPVNESSPIDNKPVKGDVSGDERIFAAKQRDRSKAKAVRMKSIRVVAREASEARRRLASMASTSSVTSNGALLRRKSTKLWGQKVVEMTPREIRNGHISKLRDQKGEYQPYFWVKGELIGKGTFGKVFLALNATVGEMMAVKQVEVPQTLSDKGSARQKEVIEALHSEVETLKDLDHLNIVQYLGFEALDDVYSLFLEYVPGGSVGRILQLYGRFEEPLIKSLTAQVLDGLSYLHSRGILHRDLKADNLLLDMNGICKISDFGISKKSRDIYANDAEMSMQGTIFWMAPEVIHNVVHNEKQGYSAKVDVWSLGCVVLEMFAGRRPWSTDEAIGAMYKLGTSRQAPPIPEDTKPFISNIGKEFIDQCFIINPEKRPTAQLLLRHEFSIVSEDFDFSKTFIAQKIRFNSKYSTPSMKVIPKAT